jgi:hypothetical protein
MIRPFIASEREGNKLPGNSWGRREATLALTFAGTCLVLSLALLPTHGAALPSPEAVRTESKADKKDRLVPYVVRSACRNEAWGNESLSCLRAINMAAGRGDSGPSRIVVALADPVRPNDFR